MGYKIQYSPDASYRYPDKRKVDKGNSGKWLLLLLVILAAGWIRINGVPDFLIPGDSAVTREAAAGLIDNLQQGSPIKEAITVFCREIIDGTSF